jgi:heme/copper-type cytochrome/quinol oxidase subunit 3
MDQQMTTRKPIEEILREREQYPIGSPRPYTPDHPNLLASGLAGRPVENVPLCSGLSKTLLIALAILAALYGAYGIVTDDLFLPEKRSPGKHFHGVAAWLIFCMILCFSGSLYAVAVSEYDTMRRNITKKKLLSTCAVGFIVFMVAGLVAA